VIFGKTYLLAYAMYFLSRSAGTLWICSWGAWRRRSSRENAEAREVVLPPKRVDWLLEKLTLASSLLLFLLLCRFMMWSERSPSSSSFGRSIKMKTRSNLERSAGLIFRFSATVFALL
jgi:hypothetical protein